MLNLTFGEQVKIVLSRKNMTIKELAETIEELTGKKMSRQNLTQRLSRDNFQEQDMRMIADILGCSFYLSILDSAESTNAMAANLPTEDELERLARKKKQEVITESEGEDYVENQEQEVIPEEIPAVERDITIGEIVDIHEELEALEDREDNIFNVLSGRAHRKENQAIAEAEAEPALMDEAMEPDHGEPEVDELKALEEEEQKALEAEEVELRALEEAEEAELLAMLKAEEAELKAKADEEAELMAMLEAEEAELKEKEAKEAEQKDSVAEESELQVKPEAQEAGLQATPEAQEAELQATPETQETTLQATPEVEELGAMLKVEELELQVMSEVEELQVMPDLGDADAAPEELEEGESQTVAMEETELSGEVIEESVMELTEAENLGVPEEEVELSETEAEPITEDDLEEDMAVETVREVQPQVRVAPEPEKSKPIINPYTGREYDNNSVRMHPKRIGYVQVYDRNEHKWNDMTEWAFLGYQERLRVMLGKAYEPPVYLD